jgi:uncharacterized damage-inducible protein DinB
MGDYRFGSAAAQPRANQDRLRARIARLPSLPNPLESRMSMTISQSMLPEFDHEMANTRKMLERVPDDRADYTPHGKSMTLGRLAAHMAQTPVWGTIALTCEEFDLTPEFEAVGMTTRAQLLETFDKNWAEVRTHLLNADDATMMKMWTFKKGGHTVLSMPKVAVLRTFMMNHMIHHRGQLGVYLRLNNVPVPGLYGPSADEM